MKLILWAKEVNKSMVEMVGGKSANLGEMYNADIPVPESFFLTSDAYKLFIERNNLWPRINEVLESIDYSSPESLSNASKKIEDLIVNATMPNEIKNEIIDNYALIDHDHITRNSSAGELLKSMSHGSYVAVRSSATAEDLPEASFAGQQATFLNVKGNNPVLRAVMKCWASLFTARAMYYRHKNNFPHDKVFLSVAIQKMVNSKKSGICFTVNPSNNNIEEMVIEAGYGLGEAIVSGSINPDTYIVNGTTFEIIKKHIGDQEWGLFRDEQGNKKIFMSDEQKAKQKLSDEDISNLAEVCKRIEKHYGKPQDIEFAYSDKQLYIVQSRPITTIKRQEGPAQIEQPASQEVETDEQSTQTESNEKPSGEVLLSGLAASPGVVSGKVVLIHDLADLEKIKQGDVLVTGMTTPDMVPAMEKSTAIVTDEGGMTCHAAIVSRELGVPSVVGTRHATEQLKDGDIITVDGNNGNIYMGSVSHEVKKTQVIEDVGEMKEHFMSKTLTKIKLIVDIPKTAKKKSELPSDGVGLVRSEFFISQSGVHPVHYLDGNIGEYVDIIANGVREIAKSFAPRPVWIRTSDLRSDEYRGLKDGDKLPNEDNPMMGEHGIRFSLAHPKLLEAEFRGIKKVVDEGFDNIGVMLPFIIRSEEFAASKKIAQDVGLNPGVDFKLGVMCETPASVWIMDDIIRAGAQFISFGTNDLTQLTLGIDRNNELIANLFSELHPAVTGQIEKVINIAKKHGVEVSICGQAGSNPNMAEKLVKLGIDSISVNSDAFYKVKSTVMDVEQKIIMDAARRLIKE